MQSWWREFPVHAVFGTVLIFRKRPSCYEQHFSLWHSSGVVDVLIWTTWGVLIFMAASVFASYSFFPQYNNQKSWWALTAFVSVSLECFSMHVDLFAQRQWLGEHMHLVKPLSLLSQRCQESKRLYLYIHHSSQSVKMLPDSYSTAVVQQLSYACMERRCRCLALCMCCSSCTAGHKLNSLDSQMWLRHCIWDDFQLQEERT